MKISDNNIALRLVRVFLNLILTLPLVLAIKREEIVCSPGLLIYVIFTTFFIYFNTQFYVRDFDLMILNNQLVLKRNNFIKPIDDSFKISAIGMPGFLYFLKVDGKRYPIVIKFKSATPDKLLSGDSGATSIKEYILKRVNENLF